MGGVQIVVFGALVMSSWSDRCARFTRGTSSRDVGRVLKKGGGAPLRSLTVVGEGAAGGVSARGGDSCSVTDVHGYDGAVLAAAHGIVPTLQKLETLMLRKRKFEWATRVRNF